MASPPISKPESAFPSQSPSSNVSGTTTPYARVDSETEKGQGQLRPVSSPDDAAAGRPIHGVKWLLVCAALYTIAFLYGLDTTIAADIQGPVIEEFGRVDQLAWIGVGFPLGSVAVQLLNGNLYAHFNLKWIFIGGIVLLEIGSVICGAAPNMDALIVGRVLAGAGGSAIYIGAVAAPIYLFYLPALRFNPTPPPFRAASPQPWSAPGSIALLVLCPLLHLASIAQQYFTLLTTPATRAFPAHLLHSRTQILLFIAAACAATSLFVTTYYIPIDFQIQNKQLTRRQFVHSDTPIEAAVRLLPYIAVTAALSAVSGHLLSRVRYYMPVYLASGVLMTAGAALLVAALDPTRQASEAEVYGYTVVMGFGTGLTVTVGYTVSGLVVKTGEEVGSAVTLQNVSQLGGTVVCLVVTGQVFQSEAVRNLGAVLGGWGLGRGGERAAVAGPQSAVFRGLTGEVREAAIGAIVGAMQRAFVLVLVAGGVMMLAAAGMKRERLSFGEAVAAM